jgi:FemAB-related protein (PEP-CTERM system-associated)
MIAGNGADLAVTTLDLGDPEQAAAADSFVMGQPGSCPFHRPAWLSAIARATGHRSIVLAAVGPSGRIVGLLPLHHVRSRLFGNALVSTGVAVGGGILSSDMRAVAALAAAAQQLARDHDGVPVELRGGPLPGPDWTTREGEHVGFIRPIADTDEDELLAVPRKHRAELRKALANPSLEVEVGRSDALLRAHYHVYAQSVRNLGTPVFPAALFRAVLDGFGEDADILLVRDGTRPVSAVLTLYHQGQVMPYWGGGIADARRLRSNELLYYRLMRHGHARGMSRFDFGRSKAGGGQAAWKKSFGFDPRPIVYHHWSETGTARDISAQSARYQRRVALWKKLPLPVANLLGPLISRGLA